MATSNSYVFGITTQIDEFIREAFARIGIKANEISQAYAEEAIMSCNLCLTSWMGHVPVPWMRKRRMISLYQGQSTYQLPNTMTNIVDVVAIQPQRMNTGGAPLSSAVASGSAANVFDPAQTAGCTLSSTDGYIGYDYGANNQYSITYIGIQPLNDNSAYKLAVQYSFNGTSWITLNSPELTTYNADQIGWIVLTNSLNARYWRILETSGATLAIQQLYFSQPMQYGQGDRALCPLSYTDWMQIANKLSPSNASGYFFDAQINPTVTMWPIPGVYNTYTALLFTAYFYPQDVQYLFQQFDIPRRYLDALCADVAWRLGCKAYFNVALDKLDRLKADKDEVYKLAQLTDQSNVIFSFKPDFGGLRP